MADAAHAEKADSSATKTKKRKLLPILIVVLALLGGGAGGGYWMYATRSSGAPAEPPPPPPPGVIDMEPFIVNLADEGGRRFLRVSVKLLTWDERQAAEAKENAVVRARIRSAILELLSLQRAEPLVTPEGKEALKKAIAGRVSEVGHGSGAHGSELKVVDVLFSEFVVQ